MTRASVCVPTASAMETMPGRKKASRTSVASSSSNPRTSTAATAEPSRPSHGSGCHSRAAIAPPGPAKADTDVDAVSRGLVSTTPLRIDLTDEKRLPDLARAFA